MKVAIAGGSGLIGSALTKALVKGGHQVYILSRDPAKLPQQENIKGIQWLTEVATPETQLEGIDAIINLAGENLNSGRWTSAKKEQILGSRIKATKEIVRIIQAMTTKPAVLINGSAIGIYGTSLTERFTEDMEESGEDFLATVVSEWEQAAAEAESDTRVVYARFGMVLDNKGGALKKMLPPFQFGIGGNLGSGQQWMSWVHIEDVVNALLHCVENNTINGPVNITAPHPVRMHEFGKALSSVIKRPYWAPVPGFLLKVALGEMSILVLEGQQVIPKKLTESQFQFQFEEVKTALANLVGK